MTEKIRKPIGKRKKLPQFTIMNVIEGQAGLENYSSLFFYSLTIDNILNIIVLLILAGIALNLTIGQNGIFSRVQTAANTWRNAETNEQLAMGELEDWMDGYLNGEGQGGGSGTGGQYNTATTVTDAKAQNKPFENDTTITDSCNPANSIRVPAGFKIAQDSATVVEDGVVIEDSDGNQFVWIPARTGEGATINLSAGGTATIVYQRTDFGYQDGSYSNYSETMPSDEEASVNAWGGYYIGRFEAGDKESTEAKTMRESRSKSNKYNNNKEKPSTI